MPASTALLLSLGLLVPLTGCTYDPPAYHHYPHQVTFDNSVPTALKVESPDHPDPLASNSRPLASDTTPLASENDALTESNDALSSTKEKADPLADVPDQLTGGAGGKPTQLYDSPDSSSETYYSYHFRGLVANAHVAILMNGVKVGSFDNSVDHSIEKHLHKGVNTVKFIYSTDSDKDQGAADISLVAERAYPPLPPFVEFRHTGTTMGATGSNTVIRTYTFIAK